MRNQRHTSISEVALQTRDPETSNICNTCYKEYKRNTKTNNVHRGKKQANRVVLIHKRGEGRSRLVSVACRKRPPFRRPVNYSSNQNQS